MPVRGSMSSENNPTQLACVIKRSNSRHGVFEAADHGERFGPPERADRKGARRLAEIILVTIPQHQAVFDEQPLVGLDRRDKPLVARVDDAERRQQQV